MPTASQTPTEIFTKLFTESRHALHRYISRFVGSSETAKEIVQEAFLRTYRQRDSVTTLRAFLFSTARNLAANEYRHRRITERAQWGIWAIRGSNLSANRWRRSCSETSGID